ncbi:SDR family NAD(P)-dependent oxidoreductase [Flexibacterium corallicola]|uniref:SDR family NAD(P)-dependent oxidoreductase n=1 Tax=Flexibacterium corallicola TaxID=3037259 RepID=UPI00286ECCBB|nr:SDR family NAD(P)-dependent oxidoreductase [Pseudovibrio sp. M1P-2-3]
MAKSIVITGATDGIGLETARLLAADGHSLLLHGRSDEKLNRLKQELTNIPGAGTIESYRADFSKLSEVEAFAAQIRQNHDSLDVLINNAGVFKLLDPLNEDGYDLRFIVNTIAPYVLTKRLLPLFSVQSRVVNLSSAAQASVDLGALAGELSLSANAAYAQSKLALTMWSFHMAQSLKNDGPVIIAVNPASFLASKMVKEAYGTQGHDLSIGAKILVRAALGEEFAQASGQYFDNDTGQFAQPHPDALNEAKTEKLVAAIEDMIIKLNQKAP